MKSKILIFLISLFLVFVFISLDANLFASIDIGEEIFVKSFMNTNFSDVDNNLLDTKTNTLQRLRLYLKGNIQENIEAKIQLQSIGIWGASTDTVKINGYYYENFNPFIEHAYIKANEFFNIGKLMKFNLIIGKQPMFYGDGYILSDNYRGVFAYKLEGICSKFCDIDLWAIKETEKNLTYEQSELDLNVYAGILNLDKYFFKEKSKDKISPYVYFVSELNKSVENVNDTKNFFGVRLEGSSEDSFFYKAEAAKEFGEVKYSTATQTYDGLFYTAGAKLKIANGVFKDSFLIFDYFNASGTDDLTGKTKNENFQPYFTNRNKEENNLYHGEIFSRIFPGISNRKIIKTGIEYLRIKNLDILVDYYSFYKTSDSKLQGNEIDLTVKKKINDFINTRLIFAMFQKSEELTTIKENVNHVSLEFEYKF